MRFWPKKRVRSAARDKPAQLSVRSIQFLESLPTGTEVIATAMTTSMEPTIREGQEIRIRRTRATRIKPGVIIAYTRNDKRGILVHRVIRRVTHHTKTWYITKGDNLQREDGYKTDPKNVLGIVYSK